MASKQNLNLGKSQITETPKDLVHQFLIVNSISAPAWGSNATIRITEKGYIHETVLAFNVNALTGWTETVGGNGALYNTPRLSPTQFWFQKIEIVQQDEVLQTIYPDVSFLRQQLFENEDDRLSENASQGILLISCQ